jgi:hypothetical protein
MPPHQAGRTIMSANVCPIVATKDGVVSGCRVQNGGI